MNSKEYIKTKLQELLRLYPQITFYYQFDEINNLHIVQVDPKDEFDSNVAFRNDEAELIFDFDNLFFPESILFICENLLVTLDSPEFILKNYTSVVMDDVLLKYNYVGIKDKEYLSGENNYALAA
ncbi:MAG: hypothetical protein Q8K69_06560 [Bacteroidota bacterium]|nr:hypothetical protein [Bacteroidota bacterium]MDP3433320.1 hypothetical protein [Bacteroidota bacterium]